MAKYFKWIFDTVHADAKQCDAVGGHRNSCGSHSSNNCPWYIIPPPATAFPNVPSYRLDYFQDHEALDILFHDIKTGFHFSMKKEVTSCEGLYGLIYYFNIPDIVIGWDIDIASFIAGAASCTLFGVYMDDIYYPRKFTTWWPTRWFFHFVEEGVYWQRSIRWLINVTIIIVRIIFRAGYGGFTHVFSRMVYYWVRKLLQGGGKVSYSPLFDDTFAALLSAYMWTSYTVEAERHTAYDRIIAIGWTAVLTGLIEYFMCQYFSKETSPGLFRWCFGGAYYGPGIWRYLKMGENPPITPE